MRQRRGSESPHCQVHHIVLPGESDSVGPPDCEHLLDRDLDVSGSQEPVSCDDHPTRRDDPDSESHGAVRGSG